MESDFTEHDLFSTDEQKVGTLVYAIKKADPAAVEKIRGAAAAKAGPTTRGPILRIDKVHLVVV